MSRKCQEMPRNEAGSVCLATGSNAYCEKLSVCSEIRVNYFGTEEEPVQPTKDKAGV